MKYKKARFVLDTLEADVIHEDNETYLGSVPNVETKILYVSNNVKIKNGAPDLTKRTTLQIALTAIGCPINSNDVYHSSSVKRAPTSGYTLYIYEGVMPVAMPEDGAVWFLNAPKSPVGTNIVLSDVVKDAAAVNNTNGYQISKSNIVQGKIAQAITKNVYFEDPIRIVIDGILKEIPASTNKYRVIGSVNEITGEVSYIIPENFEEVYSATHYLSNGKAVTTPIMLAGTVGTTRTIITTFDFSSSSLPVFISDFPVFIKNMVEFSMPEVMPERTPTIGEILQFNPPAGVDSITYYFKTFDEQFEDPDSNGKEINRWDGKTVDLPRVLLNDLGIYNIVVKYKPETTFDEDGSVIEVPAETDRYSVSTYMPLSESDITAKGPELFAPTPKVQSVDRHGQSILWILVLVLIAFLIIEWGVYYRDEY
jgi:hypothetical protein